MTRPNSLTTMGALIRQHGGELLPAADKPYLTTVAFRQRSVISSLGPLDKAQDAVVVERTYRAEIEQDGHGKERSVIMATGLSTVPYLRMTILTSGGRHWYSFDGAHHGRLLAEPHLFDRAAFADMLDGLSVRAVEDEGGTSMAPQLHVDDFIELLRFTGSDPAAAEELDVSTYSVALDFSDGTDLTYDWSLRGREDSEWEAETVSSMVYRVACSVTLTFRSPKPALKIPGPNRDPAMPDLKDVDAVWAAARARAERGLL